MTSKAEAKVNRKMLKLEKHQAPRIEASVMKPQQRKKLLIIGTMPIILEGEKIGENEEMSQALTNLKSHDAYYVPHLLYELQVEIFARLPCYEYWRLQFLNMQFSQLLKSSEIFKIMRELGLVKPYSFLLSSGATRWIMFDEDFKNFKRLPKLSSEDFFFNGDKKIISVGTQLIVIGREVEGITVWWCELETRTWVKVPAMITPRVMFGSASHETNAFFAGGLKVDKNTFEVLNVAEKYNAETKTWTSIHVMNKRRKFCSGCFLRGKFYVLGGRDENDEYLTCGESYNEVTDSWELILGMLNHMPFSYFQSPPLITVVKDNLYLLETSLDELHVYDINANTWKKLGVVPVGAHFTKRWGVAFKLIGDRILVIGASSARPRSQEMTVYKCRPSPNVEEILREKYTHYYDNVDLNHFILNCCVMIV